MPSISQPDVLRRGITMAAMLWAEPRRVVDLVDALDLERRVVERMLAGLREAGLTIEVEARGLERYHRLTTMPPWLAHAIETLAAPAVRELAAPIPEAAADRPPRQQLPGKSPRRRRRARP